MHNYGTKKRKTKSQFRVIARKQFSNINRSHRASPTTLRTLFRMRSLPLHPTSLQIQSATEDGMGWGLARQHWQLKIIWHSFCEGVIYANYYKWYLDQSSLFAKSHPFCCFMNVHSLLRLRDNFSLCNSSALHQSVSQISPQSHPASSICSFFQQFAIIIIHNINGKIIAKCSLLFETAAMEQIYLSPVTLLIVIFCNEMETTIKAGQWTSCQQQITQRRRRGGQVSRNNCCHSLIA